MPSQIPTKLSNYVLHLKNTSAISQVLRKKLNSFYSLCPLFLKDKCISSLFSMNYMEKKFNLQLFFLPTVSQTFVFSGLPCATRLLETSCLEKITVCVIKAILVTLLLVQMNKARREVNRTNQVQTKKNIIKGLQTSVIHLIPGSTCH